MYQSSALGYKNIEVLLFPKNGKNRKKCGEAVPRKRQANIINFVQIISDMKIISRKDVKQISEYVK